MDEGERIVEIGSASLENINKGVSVLKKSIKDGRRNKPNVIIYGKNKYNLKVGLADASKNIDSTDAVLVFSERAYLAMAKTSENVKKISRVVQQNALNKFKNDHTIPYQEYEDLLYNISDFLEDDYSLNVVYDNGVRGFKAFDYIEPEDMVEAIRGDLTRGKMLKGIQIRGIPRTTIYIQVKEYNVSNVSFQYMGINDNVYETFTWDGKESLTQIVYNMMDEAEYYDVNLKNSKLDKDVGGNEPKSVATKSVMNMSDDDYKEVLEDY